MNGINVILTIESWGADVVTCSGVTLQSLPVSSSQNDLILKIDGEIYCSLVFGLPSEASLQELATFLEPMRSETEEILFLIEEKTIIFESLESHNDNNNQNNNIINHTNASPVDFHQQLHQRKVFVLAKFQSEVKRNLFNALYHNMPINSYSDCPPCVVTNISNLELYSENSEIQLKMMDMFRLQKGTLKPFPAEKGDPIVSSIIPTCSLCVRRLRTSKQLLSMNSIMSDQEIAVGRSFHCNSIIRDQQSPLTLSKSQQESIVHVRCIVCYTHHYYQNKESSVVGSGKKMSIGRVHHPSSFPILGSCFDCGLLENIWGCLICGYTGCGRYSQKHAECHSTSSFHQFSLELATGRIWEYSADRFVHYEDSSSLYNGLLQQCTNFQFNNSNLNLSSLSSSDGIPSFPSVNKLLVSDSFLQDQDNQLLRTMNEDKIDKLSSLTSEYERMIELQLRDQQLYYEKLLARETVRAMEYSFNVQRGGKLQEIEYQKAAASASSAIDPHRRYLDDSQNEEQIESDFLMDKELEEIEKVKLEISSIEIEYRTLFDHLKEAEESTRQQKKQNDTILKEQKQLKSREQELLRKDEELRGKFTDQMQELEQQITDLSFFLKTKQKMDASPYKEEIANGIIFTGEAPVPAKKSSKSHNKKR